jgi:hypothetical protein
VSAERTVPTKAFSRFLYALSLRESPIVLDLGPIVGGNVNFLGERLGCKYLVEDLYQNIERTSPRRTRPISRRSSRSASRRPTPASTACCAGTCSTTWTSPRRRSSRAR